MMNVIHNKELLHIFGPPTTYGANQMWYSGMWKRRAGCGPTVCSHLMWYLSQTRPNCKNLCLHNGSTRLGFACLMEDIWRYVTPGMRGLNSTSAFMDGAVLYGKERNVMLGCRVLNISPSKNERPPYAAVFHFVLSALLSNLPVAFLNLSNGVLQNLDNWHWVTLVGVDDDKKTAFMYDQGRAAEIRLEDWLETTTLGGGFVVLEPFDK